MSLSNSTVFDEAFRNEAQNAFNNRQKDKDEKKRKKKNAEDALSDTMLYYGDFMDTQADQLAGGGELPPSLSASTDYDAGANLEAKQALAEEARTLLNTRSGKGYDADLANLKERGEELGIDEDRFSRFLEREDLKRPGIDPKARDYSERALSAEEAGFGGLAELYRRQSDARLDRPREDRSSRPLAGSGKAVKSEMDADTPPSRLLREAKSLRRRGYLGAANAIEAVAAKKLVEQTGNKDYESGYEAEKMELIEADALRQDARLRNLKQDQIEALLDKLEKMRPEERAKYLDDTYGNVE